MKTKRLAVVAACVLGAGVLTGSALGATSTWQDVWAQIKPLLSDAGTINSTDNPVHWTKLKGVPAGLADGVDNGVDRAGFGLKKNLFPRLEFAVDPGTIQRRVTGTCPAGKTIQSIAADGTVACAAGGPVVYYGWDRSEERLYANYVTVGGELPIPAGSWSLQAKVNVSGENLQCNLEARADGDVSVRDDFWSSGDVVHTTATLAGVYSSATPWRAAVTCHKNNTQEGYWYSIALTATQVAELHSEHLSF